MKASRRITFAVIMCAMGYLGAVVAEGATITIEPTDLNGILRLGSDVTVIRAVNALNQAVRSGAAIATRATGQVDIVINDPNVRAITIEVSNGVTLSANLQSLLVIDQTVSVALPDRQCTSCCRVPSRSARGRCRGCR